MTLLPCPFCGSDDVEVRLYNQPTVVCRKCLSGGPAAQRLTMKVDNKEAAMKEARELWNKRTAKTGPAFASPVQHNEELKQP